LNYVCSGCAPDWYFEKNFQNYAVTIDSEIGTWICLNERDRFYEKGGFQVPWKKVGLNYVLCELNYVLCVNYAMGYCSQTKTNY
jgi:hypothetical protein